MSADRFPATFTVPHAAALLALATSLGLLSPTARADEVQGAVISPWLDDRAWLGFYSGSLDLAALTGLPVGTRYTQVQATFTGGVIGQSMSGAIAGDYELVRTTRQEPACDYQSGFYCIHEQDIHERTVTRYTIQLDDASLGASVGSIGGFDSIGGTVTQVSTRDGGKVNDSYWHTVETIPYSTAWWDLDRNPIITTEAQLDKEDWYQTNYIDVVKSSTRGSVSVSVDLDASTLDSLSTTGLFDYTAQSMVALSRPQVLVSYTAIIASAVPEPASVGLLLAGIAAVAGLARPRRRA